jgi:choline dehydrogenase-like flavoprotein
MEDFCVIGSGPAAIAAAHALTHLNRRVLMIDGGHELDAPRRSLVERMASRPASEWSATDRQTLRAGVMPGREGVPTKRLFGSDFPFDTSGVGYAAVAKDVDVRPSFARGGLSNIWGAGILPFHPDDMRDWPIEPSALEPHYRAVLSFVPAVGSADDALSELLPDYSDDPQPLEPSSQAHGFLNKAAASRAALARKGIFVGHARLALDVNGRYYGRRPCERCGQCLFGCPYDLIYNSAFTLEALRKLPNFRYRPGFVVERLQENAGDVVVRGHDRASGEPLQLEASRVMLGAGVLSSTRIVLESLDEVGVPIRLQDSYYFLMPMIRAAGAPGIERERLTALAQAFIVVRDKEIAENLIHLSVYGYNDLMTDSLRQSAGALGRLDFGAVTDALWRSLGARSLVCGGYLHSKISPAIWMRLEPGQAGRTEVHLEAQSSDSARAVATRLGRKLMREAFRLGALAVPQAMRFPPSGRGFHVGGSFPMAKERSRHTSDIEGRPFGFDRVHLVDASTLPSIPATTITLPVMANAHRIATLASQRP